MIKTLNLWIGDDALKTPHDVDGMMLLILMGMSSVTGIPYGEGGAQYAELGGDKMGHWLWYSSPSPIHDFRRVDVNAFSRMSDYADVLQMSHSPIDFAVSDLNWGPGKEDYGILLINDFVRLATWPEPYPAHCKEIYEAKLQRYNTKKVIFTSDPDKEEFVRRSVHSLDYFVTEAPGKSKCEVLGEVIARHYQK